MKKKWKKLLFCVVFFFSCLLCQPSTGLQAAINQNSIEQKKDMEQEKDYLDEMMGEMDFSELDALMGEKTTFSDVVEELLNEGILGFDYAKLLAWAKDALCFEVKVNQRLLVEVVLLAIGFSILRNFSNAFRTAYVSQLCFLLVYFVLAVLLLQSFLAFRDIVSDTLNDSVDFMRALVPVYGIAMVFSSGVATSAGFYQIAFLAVYLIQWLFLTILLPAIHVYVILELFNHFFEDEKFQNLTELLKGFICWGMKIAGIVVLGLNVVQNLISPAKDRLLNGTVSKAAAVIPGIGNAVNGVSELLLGSGILIKNCVGAAALFLLILLGMIPVLKLLCMVFFYKLAAAVTEPMTDKRIAGCLKGMAEGGVLYLKLIVYCLVLFLLTIALTTAASSYIY